MNRPSGGGRFVHSFSCRLPRSHLLCRHLRRTGLEFESDLAFLGIPHQESLELALGAVGDEAVEQRGLAGGQQPGQLLVRDRLLQDDLTLTIMVAGTTPEDERDFGVEGGW
jgi:hypothetical protein